MNTNWKKMVGESDYNISSLMVSDQNKDDWMEKPWTVKRVHPWSTSTSQCSNYWWSTATAANHGRRV